MTTPRTLVFPGAFDPFHVAPSLAAVNAEAARLKARNVKVIVALGHLGALSGTIDNPVGPLIDLADGVTNVDAVVGDHTNFQVLDVRPNGVLVTENLSKGVRFTRIRLVVRLRDQAGRVQDGGLPQAVDDRRHPRPGDPGRDRRPEHVAAADPRHGHRPVERRRVPIRRLWQHRRPACESLVGNITTDAMRTAYASIGVQFAITNSGGLRDRLTCPEAGGGSGLLSRVHVAALPDHSGTGARRCCRSATSSSPSASMAPSSRRCWRTASRRSASGLRRAASRRSPACASRTTSRPPPAAA